VPTQLAREQIASMRGKAKASLLLAVDDIRRRGCAAAGVRLAGEQLSAVCRLDLYGAWRLLTTYDDVVPHLTVGDRPAGGVTELRAAEVDMLRRLPIQASISRVWLMTGHAAPGSWHTVSELPLAEG
jgi:hypothetical protein